MTSTPEFLKDAKALLTEKGFAVGDTWYHGTSSLLVNEIQQRGLRRSGDLKLTAAAKKTMATIEQDFQETVDPVFLTQSKELAYYWAERKCHERKVRLGGDDEPVVFAVTLPDDLRDKVKPDVGAASLLLVKEGEQFMVHLAKIYQACGLGVPDIDLMKADRMEFLTTLGMAYYDADIDRNHIKRL